MKPEIWQQKVSEQSASWSPVRVQSQRDWFLLAAKAGLVIACFGGCSYQLWAFMAMYLRFPCNTEVSTEYYGAIPFPAITICNNNKIRRSKALELFPNIAEDAMQELQEAAYNAIWTQPTETVLAMAHQQNVLVQNCSSSYLAKKERSFQQEICRNNVTIFSFTAMNCIVLNAHWNTKYKTVPKIRKSNYMYLALDFEPEEYLDNRTLKGGNIKIHNPQELADCQTVGYTVKPGSTNLIRLKVTKYELMGPPYEGQCRDYEKLQDEAGTTAGTIPQMTKHMCELDCNVRIVKSVCGCMPTIMVLTKDFHCQKCTWPRNSTEGVACVDSAFERVFGTDSECLKICPAACKASTTSRKQLDLRTMLRPC